MKPLGGFATARATREYLKRFARALPPAHYSRFLDTGIPLSSIGIGSFPGLIADEADAAVAATVARALTAGLNVIDTATHYRHGRALRAVAAGLRQAVAQGVSREAVFLISKGGFLHFADAPPVDFEAWYRREILDPGLGRDDDVVNRAHLLTPPYLLHQIDVSRAALGVETLDAFLIDQPEVHIPVCGKEALLRKLDRAFVALERAVRAGLIRHYGISSFHSFRVATDDTYCLSLPSLLFLADRAAQEVAGYPNAAHHFALIELPFNALMPEGFTRFNQVTGQGNETSSLQAALQLGVYTLGSHGLAKGHLAQPSLDVLEAAMPRLANPAQRAIQFNRSTPGLGTSLVGVSTPAHLDDLLAVARVAPLDSAAYMALYRKAEG